MLLLLVLSNPPNQPGMRLCNADASWVPELEKRLLLALLKRSPSTGTPLMPGMLDSGFGSTSPKVVPSWSKSGDATVAGSTLLTAEAMLDS